jgi:hypothetical protein
MFFRSLPPVDYIWDRGGLVAINPFNREQSEYIRFFFSLFIYFYRYRDCLFRLMTPGHTQLFLVAVDYDDPAFTGSSVVVFF